MSAQVIKNRWGAGEILSQYLASYQGAETVVVGVPQSGALIAASLARKLDAHFDVILFEWVGAPKDPEFAIGAVTEDGQLYVDDSLPWASISGEYLERERQYLWSHLRGKVRAYRTILPKISLSGKNVIVADDWVPRGLAFKAVLQAITSEKPKKIIAALPFALQRDAEEIAEYVDEAFFLRIAPFPFSISDNYEHPEKINDELFIQIISDEANREIRKLKKEAA